MSGAMVEQEEKHKIMVISILLAGACILTYYFHAILETDTVFTHFFYIPIILACIWWRRKGLAVAIFLALLILFSHIFGRVEMVTANDYFRVIMFIVIAFVVATLSERIAKGREELRELNKELEERVDARTKELMKANEQLKQEITGHKQAEDLLRDAEADWRNSFDSLEDVMLIIDRDYNIENINESGLKLLGKSKEEVIGEKCYQIISGADSPGEDCPCMNSLETKKVESYDRYEARFGKYYSIKSAPIFDDNGEIIKFVDLRRDITERKRAEEKIEASLREKEVLLREIHHRVKNNLQIISSLLNLQAMKAKDKKIVEPLLDSRSRIQTMALIHAQLYESESLEQIEMGSTIRRLLTFLLQIYAEAKMKITPVVTAEGITLPISLAIPCGLIINELVSNALKHAFTGMTEGSIEISMRESAGDRIKLTVKDNGVGIPEELDIYKTDTLGLKIVRVLAEDQLMGKMGLIRNKGAGIYVEFDKSITNYKSGIENA